MIKANVHDRFLPLKKLLESFLEIIYRNGPKQCNPVILQKSDAEVFQCSHKYTS